MSYTTIDYLPDLTYSQMVGASWLNWSSYSVPSVGWDYLADDYGAEDYALLHDTYKFTAIEGATYDIFSTSYFDPYLLRIYDQYGNTIVANDEADDGYDILLSDGGYYSQDVIYNWVAPYSGTFYVSANWNQGAYFTYYDISIYEDVDTAVPLDTYSPYVVAVTPADEATGVAVGSNIVVTFNETVQRGYGSVVLKTAAGTTVATYDAATSFNISISGNTVTINPTFDLSAGTTYKLEVSAGAVTDTSGNWYPGTSSYNFTTQSGGTGTAWNDALLATSANDIFNGLGGIDTVYYSGPRSAYSITKAGSVYMVAGGGSTDTLTSIERLTFADAHVAIDVDGNGGKAYRLYQAAFNRTPDEGGLGYQMTALDNGLSIVQVAANFIASPEFNFTYGSLNDVQFVTQLYANVLHRAPDSGGLSYHVNNLSHGFTRADILVGFSESPENQAALIGTIQNGMQYDI